MDLGLFVIRLVVGLLFVGHGTQKLFGWFGGGGLEKTAATFEGMNLAPARLMALAAGLSEAGGGALLALGLLTPAAAAALSGVMVIAIVTVHFKNGLWVTASGYEYNLVLIGAVFTITAVGPGSWSLDNLLGLDASGVGWALAELAAGTLGALATVAAGRAWSHRSGAHPPHPTRA